MMISIQAKTVFQHEASNAVLVQPERIIIPFMGCKVLIAATRTDDHGGAGGIGGIRQIRRDRGDVVAESAQCAGRSVWPEWNGIFHLSKSYQGGTKRER